LEAAVPQQRKLVIVTTDNTTLESTVVTLSDDAEKELKKAVDQAKAHGGQISSVDLRKP
jgi:predicted lactoylglutathione lyase